MKTCVMGLVTEFWQNLKNTFLDQPFRQEEKLLYLV